MCWLQYVTVDIYVIRSHQFPTFIEQVPQEDDRVWPVLGHRPGERPTEVVVGIDAADVAQQAGGFVTQTLQISIRSFVFT